MRDDNIYCYSHQIVIRQAILSNLTIRDDFGFCLALFRSISVELPINLGRLTFGARNARARMRARYSAKVVRTVRGLCVCVVRARNRGISRMIAGVAAKIESDRLVPVPRMSRMLSHRAAS